MEMMTSLSLVMMYVFQNGWDKFKDETTESTIYPWWRHQMETFSALLAICAGNLPVPGEFPAQRPVTQSFGVFFDLRLNKRLKNNREAILSIMTSLWCSIWWQYSVIEAEHHCGMATRGKVFLGKADTSSSTDLRSHDSIHVYFPGQRWLFHVFQRLMLQP